MQSYISYLEQKQVNSIIAEEKKQPANSKKQQTKHKKQNEEHSFRRTKNM